MNKRKNAVLLIITIAFLLVMVVTATYAFLISNETNDYANIVIESNIAVTNGEFKTTGGNLDLNVSIANMMESQAGTLAASNNTLLNVSYKSGEVESYTCSYDIYYKWENGTDSYTISDANQKEFTYEIKDGYTVIVPETNFVASSNTTPQKLTTEKLEIDNKGNNPTMQSYNIITKYYNLAAEQKQNAGKDWKISFYVDNVVCGAVTGTVTLTNNGSTQTQNVLGSETTFALSSPVGTNISCNNSAVPSYDNGTVTISHIRGNTTCNVNSTIDSSINNADTTLNTYQMISNDSITTTQQIDSTKKISINFNGYTISYGGTSTSYFNLFHVNGGVLNFYDDTNSGGVIIDNNTSQIIHMNQGILNVYGGNYKSGENILYVNPNDTCYLNVYNGNFIIDSETTNRSIIWLTNSTENKTNIIANIYNGDFKTNNSVNRVIYVNRGTLNINGGTFTSIGRTVDNYSGIININDGNFESTSTHAIYNDTNGIINFNGEQPTFDENDNYVSGIYVHINMLNYTGAIINFGEININGGLYEANYVVLSPSSATSITRISNAQIIAKDQTSYGSAICINNGSVIINEGAYVEGPFAIGCFQSATASVTVNGGTIVASKADGICLNFNDGASATINGGTVKAARYTIFSDKNTTININNCILDSTNIAIFNNGTGIINVCKATLLNNNTVQTGSAGKIYYAPNAFGSITPTFSGTTANIIQNNNYACNW